jgi:hypothetical protein
MMAMINVVARFNTLQSISCSTGDSLPKNSARWQAPQRCLIVAVTVTAESWRPGYLLALEAEASPCAALRADWV